MLGGCTQDSLVCSHPGTQFCWWAQAAELQSVATADIIALQGKKTLQSQQRLKCNTFSSNAIFQMVQKFNVGLILCAHRMVGGSQILCGSYIIYLIESRGIIIWGP